jgi:hypothetical protein
MVTESMVVTESMMVTEGTVGKRLGVEVTCYDSKGLATIRLVRGICIWSLLSPYSLASTKSFPRLPY